MPPLVIVDDFHVMSAVRLPAKAQAPLVVDSNRELTLAVASESFEPIARNRSEGREGRRRVESLETAFRGGAERFEGGNPATLSEMLGRLATERTNHRESSIGALPVTSSVTSGASAGFVAAWSERPV
jgi:hypothetical protein